MIIDLTSYRKTYFNHCIKAYEEGGVNSLSSVSSLMGVPIAAVYKFCLEKYPKDAPLLSGILVIEDFYDIKGYK